ncbi:MAG: helix-turn-helix transcriptional regulator [Tannerella sp.]|jgi:AraC-like DNA-binding protein/mannose-6-phosphate isomerase-like protein (cupin superfamily)|nr:helix-turn-helix transcriptional regulator [Tannerella sp.]
MTKKTTSIPVTALDEEYDAGIVMMQGMTGLLPLPYEVSHSHRHDYHLFFLGLKGNGLIEVDFEQQEIKAPAVLYTHPNQVHRIVKVENVEGYFLGMKNEHLNPGYLNTLEQVILPAKPLPLTDGVAAIIHRTMSVCTTIFEQKTNRIYASVLKDYCNACVGFIVSQYLEQASEAGNPSRFDDITKKFKLLLERDFASMKHPSGYADALNISTPYLNECVRNVTGFPVSRHIQQRIILEAKRLLYHSGKSVKEIASALGYDDYAYFSRLFTKIEGMTAVAFRNKNRD